MSAIDLVELAWGIFPSRCEHRVVAMLFGYFDESGTDGQHGHTVISGFVGSVASWSKLSELWEAENKRAGIKTFHYADCINQINEYRGFKYPDDVNPHLENMADIIINSDISVVSAGYSGNWNDIIAVPEWKLRFPSAYNFCAEAVLEKIARCSRENWFGEQVAVIFAKQRDYERRHLEIWETFKYNNQWPEIYHFGISDPSTLTQLQAADMIAYESRRLLHKGRETFWKTQPLLKKLVPIYHQTGSRIFDLWYDTDAIKEMLGSPGTPRAYLKALPTSQARGGRKPKRGR